MSVLLNPERMTHQDMTTVDPARAAIVTEALTKRFKSAEGTVQALAGVSFTVERERIFTILGPNGAGKTTLLRILTTMMRPTTGTAWIEGFEIGRQNINIRNLIGIVAQDNHFDKYLSVWQNLVLHAQMHGMEEADYTRRINELLERVGLNERRNDCLDDFSGGMQRRVALIRALIHEPKLLFMDEPTTGLDPAARREIWDTLQDLKRRTTVILTTHYMEEADRLSDHILILNRGQVTMSGTANELKSLLSPPGIYELHLTRPDAAGYLRQLAPLIHDATLIGEDGLCFQLNQPDNLAEIVRQIPPAELKSLGLAQADLETVYLSVAGQPVPLLEHAPPVCELTDKQRQAQKTQQGHRQDGAKSDQAPGESP
jgi:ABC-2 type transport system ATP-binding protein